MLISEGINQWIKQTIRAIIRLLKSDTQQKLFTFANEVGIPVDTLLSTLIDA
jgi:hypothetical protein